MDTVNISKNGSISLPARVLERAGFAPGTALAVSVVGDELRLRPRRSEVGRFVGVFARARDARGAAPAGEAGSRAAISAAALAATGSSDAPVVSATTDDAGGARGL